MAVIEVMTTSGQLSNIDENRGPKLEANIWIFLAPQISRPSAVSFYDNEGPWFTCTKRNNKWPHLGILLEFSQLEILHKTLNINYLVEKVLFVSFAYFSRNIFTKNSVVFVELECRTFVFRMSCDIYFSLPNVHPFIFTWKYK